MSQRPSSSPSSWLGLSLGWSYALAAFTLTITSCLPLALLATMHNEGSGAQRAQALMLAIPSFAALVALVCAAFYFLHLRHRTAWHRHALMVMWSLSALGMVGWWKL
ncbi:MAG: hypothetical protein KBT18_01555 [Comamonas sp.]|nr:hypothetical protein [Candidatus Comamonas equi]